jgi:hypothetical protein
MMAEKEIDAFIFHVPGLKPPPLGGQLLAIERTGGVR